MVRVRVRVIFDCEGSLICVHNYGGIISEDASLTQQRIGPCSFLCDLSRESRGFS